VPRIEGVKDVIKALKKVEARLMGARAKAGFGQSVVVGYTAAYALAVHENIEMKWRGFPRDRSIRAEVEDGKKLAITGHHASKKKGLFWGPAGQAKFLEQPARELSNDGTLARIVMGAMAKGKTMLQGLLLAGLRLQRESQKLVPVDTGNLKSSAFTRIE
jgi:hypothetical protein